MVLIKTLLLYQDVYEIENQLMAVKNNKFVTVSKIYKKKAEKLMLLYCRHSVLKYEKKCIKFFFYHKVT